MSHAKKLVNTSEYALKQSIVGKKQEKYIQPLQKMEPKDSLLHHMKKIENPTYIPEYLQKNKKMISNDKLNTSKIDILNSLSYKTSEVELILKERDLTPFWTLSSKELSTKLSSIPKIGYADSDLNLSRTFANGLIQKSSLSTTTKINQINKNLQKTYYPLSQSLLQNTMAQENIQNCQKIRIYPNKKQQQHFSQFFGTSRYIYNKCVEYYKHKISWIKRQSMRKIIMGKDSDLPEHLKWLTNTPYDTRQFMIDSFIGSYESAKTNLKNGKIDHFDFYYKSKKQPNQMFFINKKALDGDLNIFKRKKLGKIKLRKKEKQKIKDRLKKFESNLQILKNGNKYYLCIPYKKPIKELKEDKRETFVALDPGVRNFQTFFSEMSYGEIGKNISQKIKKLNEKEDKLKSLIKTEKERNSKWRYNLRRKCLSLRIKMKNIVSNLHWQTASFLVNNYKIIFLPTFETSNMVSNKKDLNKDTKRSLLKLSHYKFSEKLKYLSTTIKNTLILRCDESYTSKLCSNCGKINNVGKSKIYNCDNCKIKVDRDLNGAKNILIKQLTKLHG